MNVGMKILIMKKYSTCAVIIISLIAFCFPVGNSGNVYAQSLNDAIKLTESEQFEKASDALVKLIQSGPTQGDYYFYLGENYFKEEIIDSTFKAIDLDSAKACYAMGMKKNPGNPLNYVGMGKAYWYEGNQAEAKKLFYDAVQIISPQNKSGSFTSKDKATVYYKIAECYTKAKNKDLPGATNMLNKALKEDPNNTDVLILLGDVMLEENPGEASKAITMYKKAYDLDKKSAKALLRIGQLYNRARNLTEAVNNYDEAIKVSPSFAPAYREKAEAFYRGKQYETAILNYKKYLELNSGSISARVRYASFLFLSKKYQESISEILDIQKTNASIPFLYRLLAYSYYELDKHAEGLAAIETFFSKASEKKILGSDYAYFGKLLSKAGNDSLAIEKLKLAISKDTSNVELLGEVGNSFLKAKKYPEAIDAYNKKIASNIGVGANDYYNLGRSYYYSSQFGKADTAFMQIIVLQPDIPTGYLWRGKANEQMDADMKKGLAKPHYEEFLSRIKPEEVERNKRYIIPAYEYIGYYFMLQKDYGNAKCYYQKLQGLEPDNKKAKAALGEANVSKAACSQQ